MGSQQLAKPVGCRVWLSKQPVYSIDVETMKLSHVGRETVPDLGFQSLDVDSLCHCDASTELVQILSWRTTD